MPFTSHPMFGHDIIYTHPMNCGAAIGRAAERDFLTFADFFWDGALADILVQSRIHECRNRVNDSINKIERIIRELKRYD